ncbi:MAG: hypothetical protein HQL17_03010 [Candidatus Omnitrophica bacterium]|nr:hypothetical protein [Candidatus Omnitrophota bacterium]
MFLIIGVVLYIGVFFYALYLAFLGFKEMKDGPAAVKGVPSALENELQELKGKYEKTVAELDKFKYELTKKNGELATLGQEKEALAVELFRIQNQLKGDSAKSVELASKDLEILKLKTELDHKIAELRKSENELQWTGTETKKVKDELQSSANRSQALEQEMRVVKAELEKAQGQSAGASKSAAEISAKDQEIARLSSMIDQVNDASLKLKNDLQTKNGELTNKERELQALDAELEKAQLLFAGASKNAGDVAAKDREIERLAAELEKAQSQSAGAAQRVAEDASQLKEALAAAKQAADDYKKKYEQVNDTAVKLKNDLQTRSSELTGRERELQALKAELEKVQDQPVGASVSVEELAAKDSEIERLSAEIERLVADQSEYKGRVAKLKKSETEISQIERSLDEEKQALRAMKLRVSEGKMKLQLLSEKTKETVEMIAQFAEGKEFEEFRKSIHMDETVQKYEDEIKDLQIKILALEQKA